MEPKNPATGKPVKKKVVKKIVKKIVKKKVPAKSASAKQKKKIVKKKKKPLRRRRRKQSSKDLVFEIFRLILNIFKKEVKHVTKQAKYVVTEKLTDDEDGPTREIHGVRDLLFAAELQAEKWLESKGVPVSKIKLRLKKYYARFKNYVIVFSFLFGILVTHLILTYVTADRMVIVSRGFGEIASEWCDPSTPFIRKTQIIDPMMKKYVIWSGTVMDITDKGDYFTLQLKLCRQELTQDITVKFRKSEYEKLEWIHAGDLVKFKGRIRGWNPVSKVKVDNAEVAQVVPRIIDDKDTSSEILR